MASSRRWLIAYPRSGVGSFHALILAYAYHIRLSEHWFIVCFQPSIGPLHVLILARSSCALVLVLDHPVLSSGISLASPSCLYWLVKCLHPVAGLLCALTRASQQWLMASSHLGVGSSHALILALAHHVPIPGHVGTRWVNSMTGACDIPTPG